MVANLGARSEDARTRRPQLHCPLHYRRDRDAHDRQRGDEFTADYGYRCEQELFSFFVGFAEDRMAVVEGVEELRQLEDVLGQIGGFGGGDALIDDVRGLGGG